jgi:hypothetical protein
MSECLVRAPGSIEPDTVPCVQLYRHQFQRGTQPESADLNLAFSVQFPGFWSTELKVRLPSANGGFGQNRGTATGRIGTVDNYAEFGHRTRPCL